MTETKSPFVFDLARWSILGWTLTDVVDVVGSDTEIQYQARRLDNPDYERTPYHETDRFGRFATRMVTGEANDVYLIARNKDDPRTAQALAPLLSMCRPLPSWLQNDPCSGFVWLGRGTMTPLHYDTSDNTMCQVIGEKHVRIFSPDQTDRLDPTGGVYSSLGWVGDSVVSDRSLAVHDAYLRPGIGVYIPQGWWHCVVAPEVSMTMVFTCQA
jgi:hypothetical protein